MHPTLPTLLRIALVFSVGLDHFFTPEPKPVLEIVRKADRIRFPDSPGSSKAAYHFESLDFTVARPLLSSYLAEFEPVEIKNSRFHEHAGVEFLYVISGKLELHTRAERHELGEGDAIYFDSSVPHAYRRATSKRTVALVVTATE